jgi:hypothetical protein
MRTLDRLFLRNCAFLMRLYEREDAEWVWTYASLSVTTIIANAAFLVLIAVAALLRDQLPPEINPLTATKEVRYIEFITVGLLVHFWVGFRFQRFKHDVTSASRFASHEDRWKILWALVLSICCLLGMVVIQVAFVERR